MRSFILAAVAALAFATAADASDSGRVRREVNPDGPYQFDSNGQCRAADGQAVTADRCATPPNCTTGVACGGACIPKGEVCRQPG